MNLLSLRIAVVVIAILFMLNSNFSCIQIKKISKKTPTDSIIFIKVFPKKYFEYNMGKFLIYGDTISVEWFLGYSKNISKARFSGRKEIIGIISDSIIRGIDRRCKLNYESYNFQDYVRKKPSLICIGFDSVSTDVYYPLGLFGHDSILNIPVLSYYFDKASSIENVATLDSIMKSPPKDSANHVKLYKSIVHPIFGLIDGFESGRAIDTLYYIKGSYKDIIQIERRLGIR